MRQSRFTEEQIIAILAEQERGLKTAEVCREHGISPTTFYKWKAKYGGLDVSDARKLKSLETENVTVFGSCTGMMVSWRRRVTTRTGKKMVLGLSHFCLGSVRRRVTTRTG